MPGKEAIQVKHSLGWGGGRGGRNVHPKDKDADKSASGTEQRRTQRDSLGEAKFLGEERKRKEKQ